MSVAPNLNLVKKGFEREDLFVCVHEQFMTETAKMADVILPATMFLEHDDIYQAGGHQHIQFGPKAIDPPGECRSNHEVISELAARLDAKHRGFSLTAKEVIDETLINSGWENLETLENEKWFDAQPNFKESHFISGFGHPDKRWHFSTDWSAQQSKWGLGSNQIVDASLVNSMPALPDHWNVLEASTLDFPF